jgi:predicted metal-binding protein
VVFFMKRGEQIMTERKTLKDEEGNDVVFITSISKEEIEKRKKEREENFKKSLEKIKKAIEEAERIRRERISTPKE